MNLETAVCLLAACTVIASIFTLIMCYAINQLTVRNLNAAQQLHQLSTANVTVADRLLATLEHRNATDQTRVN